MICAISLTYRGFNIVGTAHSVARRWRSSVLLEKLGFEGQSQPVSPTCTTPGEALQQALAAGRSMIDAFAQAATSLNERNNENALDEALEQSFPASDPTAVTSRFKRKQERQVKGGL